MANRRGGIINLVVDGNRFDAKGNFSFGLGKEIRESIIGADGVHGFKSTVSAPFIEGEITDSAELSLETLSNITDATVTLILANGKAIVLRNAFITNADGLSGSTEEGAVAVRFEGLSAEEVR